MNAKKTTFSINDIDVFIFDFDGVLTNNRVHLDQNGREWVTCNRSDGLAFDVLRKINKPVYIFSTEKNPVVTERAKKLKIEVLQGISDKVAAIHELTNKKKYLLSRVFYVGNDLNDFKAMQQCGYTACPSDSHSLIKETARINLASKGGDGVVRELLEDIIQLDFINILYSK